MNANNISRREFGKRAAIAGAALGALGLAGCAAPKKEATPISIQLYTVRELTSQDFVGTLRKVAAIGYKAFEFAGYGDLTAKELKTLMDELGVVCSGTHTGIQDMQNDLQAAIDFNLGLGTSNIVCPYMPGEFQQGGVEGYKKFAALLNEYGGPIKQAGMQLSYHNHNFEFAKTDDGKYLYDVLLENTDPDLVKLEADLYWVKRAGLDPVEYMKTYADRLIMLHMKDMTADDKHFFAPVGTGVMDFPAIITAAREIGIEWFVVEEDRSQGDVMQDITVSFTNLNKMLNA